MAEWLKKESACQRRRRKRRGFNPSVRKTPWSRKWQPTPVFLPRKARPWGRQERTDTDSARMYPVNADLLGRLSVQPSMSSIALGIQPALLGQHHKALQEAGLPLPTGSCIASSKMHRSFPKRQAIQWWPGVEYQLQNASVLPPW